MKKLFSKIKKSKEASYRLILTIALPLIITNSSQSLMQFTDRMFLSWFSPEALAACVPAGLLSFTMISFFMGSCGYTAVFVANYFGRKKYARLSVALWQGVLLGVISWLLIILLTPLGRFFINSTNHATDVKTLELSYFTILTLFGGLAVINNALASFFTGRGKTLITMLANIGGNIINVFLSYIMIFGKLGLPKMGIAGAAYSTVISGFCVTLFFLYLLFRPELNKKFRLGKLFGFNKPAIIRLLRFGVPNGFGMFMDVISFTIFVLFVGNIDSISLAASNIIMTLQTLEFFPLMGLTIAGQILMAQYRGANKTDTGVKALYNVFRLSLIYEAALFFCFFTFPETILGAFIGVQTVQTQAIYASAIILLPFLFIFTLGDTVYLTFGDGLRGAGDTKFQMKLMIICASFLMLGSYLIVEVFGGGIISLWTWMCIYGVGTGVWMMCRFWSGKWRKIDITK
ncbi:MAG: MATE family efflux transporter [Elusimicrobiaceae bacterium]|nr:MATE family efflux transporter [Elusimicrobiaceae bacterium]